MEYSITFTENCSPKLSAKLIDCFKSAGLLCESVYEGNNSVYVGATFESLVDKVMYCMNFNVYFDALINLIWFVVECLLFYVKVNKLMFKP
jgi:hypothetical protein